MNRNYVGWYKLKADMEKRPPMANFHAREIWWCSLGANIGFEEDGKNALFERPVLILRKFNKELFFGVPLTSAHKEGNKYYHCIVVDDIPRSALISQARTLSSRRLLRKVERHGKKSFGEVLAAVTDMLQKTISADFSAESPVPSGSLYSDNSKHKRKSQAKKEKL